MTEPNVLLFCWSSRERAGHDHPAVTKRLLIEVRSTNLTAKYWYYIREFPVPPFPPLASGIGVWLTSDENATELYKATRTWLDVNRDCRVEVTLWHRPLRYEVIGGNIQFDITDMTQEEFLALFDETSPVRVC